MDSLSLFHPLIQKWFSEKLGKPTDIQESAWKLIAKNKNVFITAPTGSGKTLTAFLWMLNRFVTGEWETGVTKTLYISPLKALNNDIRKNLQRPLAELREVFEQNGVAFPKISVMTRSGDSSEEERRRMIQNPPEILITTPETLNILLTSKNNRMILRTVSTVILDEIHNLLASKRGTYLITAVERLTLLCGDFQRIALSATVNPIESAVEFAAGYENHEGSYVKRPMEVVRSAIKKKYRIAVRYPPRNDNPEDEDSIWAVLAKEFKTIIARNNSTILFSNSRRQTEKIARFINENEEEILAYAHHGSLSKELRLTVEEKLKNGELKAIVATNTLELGIDIGELDEVVLVESPPSISSAIQRIGRAGHGVGEESIGNLYPLYSMDFIGASVVADSMMKNELEPVKPIEGALDVLAQVLLSMCVTQVWNIDWLYDFIRTAYPYRNLSKKHYMLVLSMLAGRYADTRIRELSARVSIDKLDNTVCAKNGVPYLLYISGGTIADRGYFNLRHMENKAKIGELDEEFVWERHIGDSFAFGSQVWTIHKITDSDVEVLPANAKPGIIAFWRSLERNRDYFFSEKIALFLEEANHLVESPQVFLKKMKDEFYFDDNAARAFLEFLLKQKETTKTDLPHRHHLVIEHYDDPYNRLDAKQVILHTLWGGKINRPFLLALSAAWEEKYQYPLEVFCGDDSMILMLPHHFNTDEIFEMVNPSNVDTLIRKKLENTSFFGAKFRENAAFSLLLPKGSFNKRMPLWFNRLRSKKILEAVKRYEDFPVLIETWRSCYQEEFDMENLKSLLDEVLTGSIRISHTVTEVASPFCSGIIWRQVNKYMYEDETPDGSKISNLSDTLLKEILYSDDLRPKIDSRLMTELQAKLKRTAIGYAPQNEMELLDLLKDWILIPVTDWESLLSAMERDNETDKNLYRNAVGTKCAIIQLNNASQPTVVAIENLPTVLAVFHCNLTDVGLKSITPTVEDSAIVETAEGYLRKAPETESLSIEELVLHLLSYQTAIEPELLSQNYGLRSESLSAILESLVENGSIIYDILRADSTTKEICHSENLEILLRIHRNAQRSPLPSRKITELPLLIATLNGLTDIGQESQTLQEVLSRLFGYPAHASLWEESIFPSRFEHYYPSWLDSLLQQTELEFFGVGNKKITFAFGSDKELFWESKPPKNALLPDNKARYTFYDIQNHTRENSETLTKRLWELLWKNEIQNDSFEVMRRGIQNKFTPEPLSSNENKGRRSGFNRWATSRPILGNWYQSQSTTADWDEIEKNELQKDRVRQLLARYGILFRELLAYEMPLLQWSKVFKTLRLMEFSGEVQSGYFFEGIAGPQFASFEAQKILANGLDEHCVYHLNASDPSSLCGVKVEGLKNYLPERVSSTDIVFQGQRLVLISRKYGKSLEIADSPNHPRIPEYLSFFKTLLSREFNPLKSILVEEINGVSAKKSEYAPLFKDFGFSESYKGLELWRKYDKRGGG